MDTLHSVLRAIRRADSPETKSLPAHLAVFRAFLAHLERLQHKAPARQAPRHAARRRRSTKR